MNKKIILIGMLIILAQFSTAQSLEQKDLPLDQICHWSKSLDNILYPAKNSKVAIGLKETNATFEVNGTTILGDASLGEEDGEPVDVLVIQSLWNPGILFQPTEDPTVWARTWYDNAQHEFYIRVTDGYNVHDYSFDGHGSFKADTLYANSSSVSQRFIASNQGTQTSPSFRYGFSGMYFPDMSTIGFVTNNTEKMRLDSNGNLNVSGNINVDGCIRHSCGTGTCTTIGVCI